MADTIFINYRREDSISTAGRLHDRLAQTFGKKNLFMDVDSIPAGVDFVTHLNSQVAACDVILVVIGPNWLNARDESGGRRLDNPDDFVAIEISAALARDIRVVPVLVDGAHMPKARELPDSLKSLARRQAVEVRHTHFGKDAEALVARMREALGHVTGAARWRVRAAAGVAAAVLLLVGVGGYTFLRYFVEQGVHQAELKGEEERAKAAAEVEAKRKAEEAEQERQARAAAEVEAKKRKAEEAEQQRLAAVKADQERQARAAAEAEAKRKTDEAEQQRVAAVKAEQERQAEAEARYQDAIKQGMAAGEAGDFDKAIGNFSEAIRLNPNNALAFANRGLAYATKGDYDRAMADYREAIRLNPNNALAFANRGLAYAKKGDLDRAIADFDEAIRLGPNNAAFAFHNRGVTYSRKGDYGRAIADYNEAIRLNPKDAVAFCARGMTKRKIKDRSADTDIAKARQLGHSCQ